MLEWDRLYPDGYLGDIENALRQIRAGAYQRSRSWKRLQARVGLVDEAIGGGRILDVGCGAGLFLLALDGRRWERTGVEPIHAAIAAVRTAGFADIDWSEGDLFDLNAPERSFDCITFWSVVEHLSQPRRTLTEAARLLRPGGKIFVSVPNFASLQSTVFGRHWYHLDLPRHLHHFTVDSLNRLSRQAGLQPVRRFARLEVLHGMKQSLLSWSEERFSSRVPYYLAKPALWPLYWLERGTGRTGDILLVAGLQDEPE